MGSVTRSSEAEPLIMKIVALRADIRRFGQDTRFSDDVRIEEMLLSLDEILDDVYDALV